MIRILLYLTSTRSDIMQAAGLVAQFQAASKESHVNAIKRILNYLKGTMDFGLWFPRGEYFSFKTYMDTNRIGSVDEWKSTSGGAFFLRNCLVSWLSKKQASISLSIVEAEYIAATCCT